MNPDIKLSVKRLFIKFFLFQVGLLAAAVLLSILFTGYFKQRLAGQLTSAVREALLCGDNRQAMVALPESMSADFEGVVWAPAAGGGFSLPDGGATFPAIRAAAAEIPVYFDENRVEKAGSMRFFYPRWTPVAWAFMVWVAIVLLSLPVAFLERNRLVREYELTLDLKIKESYSTLAAQVAHDIRSPLAALGAAAKGLSASAEQRQLIEGAVGRMQGIADDLLKRYRSPGMAEQSAAKPVAIQLARIVEQVVEEKRLQHAGKAGVKINFESEGGELKAAVDAKELQRAISNLVNNAVEAFEKDGTVLVKVSSLDGRVLIAVKDDGKGIPADILAKLGKKGETHGKSGGTGLGLYHAKASAESWGGGLKIESEPGKGTVVTMDLPRAGASDSAHKAVVLLDDDMLVHMNWRMAAKAAGAELKAFKTGEELKAAAEALPKDIPVYIDAELGDGVKGEEVAEWLRARGFSDISMATGHAPNKFAGLPWLKVRGKEPPWGG